MYTYMYYICNIYICAGRRTNGCETTHTYFEDHSIKRTLQEALKNLPKVYHLALQQPLRLSLAARKHKKCHGLDLPPRMQSSPPGRDYSIFRIGNLNLSLFFATGILEDPTNGWETIRRPFRVSSAYFSRGKRYVGVGEGKNIYIYRVLIW